MLETFAFISSVSVTYWAHNFFERFLNKKFNREVRLRFFGYHIHHSCFGLTAILVAVFFSSGVLMLIILGYGTGNLWQHKVTHNRVNEKGLVFITKA